MKCKSLCCKVFIFRVKTWFDVCQWWRWIWLSLQEMHMNLFSVNYSDESMTVCLHAQRRLCGLTTPETSQNPPETNCDVRFFSSEARCSTVTERDKKRTRAVGSAATSP